MFNNMVKGYWFLIVAVAALISGCSQEKYAYVGDAPRDEAMPINNQTATILQPGDRLYIYVYSLNPTSVRPFNQETNMIVAEGSSKSRGAEVNGYTISETGSIIFPVVGRIPVAGKTLTEVEREIEARLVEGRLVKDPIVSASLMNFRVTVIGEVKKPQAIEGNGIRMTIFEAIARCGDVTMDGIRSKVTVMRPADGTYTVDTVDLTSRSVLESQFYYLQSGDIVYVEPTKKKKRVAYRDEDWPHYLTTGASTLRLAWTIYYRYMRIERQLQKNR